MEIKKGTKVIYRPCFGIFEPIEVVVSYVQRSEYKRCKYGNIVESVPFAEREYCVFGLSDGHWCYGEQIDNIVIE